MKLPTEALEKHIAILGMTGSGKTYAGKGIVEWLLEQGRQVCIIDPTDAWWGMRLSANGKREGYDLVLIGGKHGDIPLSERSGAACARLVTEQGANVVVSTRRMRVGEYTRWFIDFAETLTATIERPLHLVIDEAHRFMPQGGVPSPQAGQMLHLGNDLMSGGRAMGIRAMVLTQRPAKFHKDSLTCANTLVAMQVIAPQDRKAIKEWVDGCGNADDGRKVLESLAGLDTGEGWIWYPKGDHLKRVKFPRIKSFDSSKAPEHGSEAPPAPAEINLDAVRTAMAEAVKEAEANDPALLRSKIVQLQNELRSKPAGEITQEQLNAEVARARHEAGGAFRDPVAQLRDTVGDIEERLGTVRASLSAMETLMSAPKPIIPVTPMTVQPRSIPPAVPRSSGATIKRGHARTLEAFLWYEQLGIDEPDDGQLCFYAGYRPTSSTMSVILSELRRERYVDGRTITDAGRAMVDLPPAGTLDQFHDRIRSKMGGGARKVFDLALSIHPREATKEEFCEHCGWSVTSSTLSVATSELRRIGVMESRGHCLTNTVFPALPVGPGGAA